MVVDAALAAVVWVAGDALPAGAVVAGDVEQAGDASVVDVSVAVAFQSDVRAVPLAADAFLG